MDKLDLIVKKIDDLKDDAEKKLDALQESTDHIKSEMIEMGYDVRKNTDDLKYHIKRTDIADDRLKRLEDILTVSHLLKLIVTVAAGIGTIAGTIYGIKRLIDIL